MSAGVIASMAAPEPSQAPVHEDREPQIEVAGGSAADGSKPTGLHSPPDSNNAMKLDGSDDSELSDLDENDPVLDFMPPTSVPPPAPDREATQDGTAQEDHAAQDATKEDDDIGEIVPDHYSGTVPVFRPTMFQFKDFKKFMEKIDSYGMKSGIVKVIPPDEWKAAQPSLDDMVKPIRVREPIKQDIMGSNGTYRQVNILHQRSYNLPQWRQLCDQSEHQPPAKRGERRANIEKPKPARPKAEASSRTGGTPRKRGGKKSRPRRSAVKEVADEEEERPMTPVSPKPAETVMESVEHDVDDPGAEIDDLDDDSPVVGRMGARPARPKTQSTSARRKYARREASAKIDEEAFRDWDYRMDISDYTGERCEELERIYWKTLTYAPPLYGADLPGTLFDDQTTEWNLSKLPNLLDVMGTKIPGVNTAYLYLGMWKATFAWHLEDVDLYSINYLHFGAPKQWYSISQGDARRFEAAMKSIWPTDAKACDQFLRHKAFLISPNHLQQYFNIKVNKCLSYPGEFVVTYPYGYHSGYNLGYNCAEAVNFALDSWLPMGKIAKRCECAQAQDSVWIDVREIERKLRGEETDFEETDEDDEEDDEEDDDEEGGAEGNQTVRFKIKQTRKRKRVPGEKTGRKIKKIRLRLKSYVEPPCCLCPNNILDAELLNTDDGRKAHRTCGLYGAETWIETVDGEEIVANVANISKARLELKCLYCRSKRGVCFQCSQKKCARSYHATCAAAAGVFVEEGEVPVFGEDGTEYKEQAFEFSCRFHRTKRDKKLDGDALDECVKTRQAAAALKKGDIAQLQYYRGEIFAAVVVESRPDEHTFLVEVIPNGDRVEVEWKWLLHADPADFHLPKASPNAIPMPTSRKAKDEINATKRVTEELPRKDDAFLDGYTWAEFHHTKLPINQAQVKVDFSKETQLWHYLGKTSTEARAQYTDDVRKPVHNTKSNFLDTIPKPPPPVPQPRKQQYMPPHAYQSIMGSNIKTDRPYQYKPKPSMPTKFVPSLYTSHQFATKTYSPTPSNFAAQSSYQGYPPAQPPGSSFQSHYTNYQFQYATQPPTRPVTGQAPHPPRATVPMPLATPPTPTTTTTQVAAPAASPAPKAAPPRNKSLSFGSLSFGSDSRFRTTSSTYASSSISSSSSSPFSFGVPQTSGLGRLPSSQNGSLFKAQARERSSSEASAKSATTPMTSSAITPLSSSSGHGVISQPSAMKLPGISQPSLADKYGFFQVHHNRDSTKYRSPYAHWGGFTNGYEGSLRAYLTETPNALFDKTQSGALRNGSTLPAMSHLSSGSSMRPASQPAHSPYGGAATTSTALNQPGAPQIAPGYHGQQSMRSSDGSWDIDQLAAQLHPAIRSQYAALLQKKTIQAQTQARQQAFGQGQGQQGQSQPQTISPMDTFVHMAPHSAPAQSDSSRHGSGVGAISSPGHTPTPAARKKLQYAIPAKQTFVPPPKPWESVQATQPRPQTQLPKTEPEAVMTEAIEPEAALPKTATPEALGYDMMDSVNTPPSIGSAPCGLDPITGLEPSNSQSCFRTELGQPRELPECPEESMTLVEDIVRAAQWANASNNEPST